MCRALIMEEDASHDQLVSQGCSVGQSREDTCGTYLEKAADVPEVPDRGAKWTILESEIGRLAAAWRQISRQAGHSKR